ncbi:MAG TPA: sulfatase-like hydrolase/transferase, partial [Holophagaceae bacterium]|nr:sulfatase-like hydrolase/transferase [Holophagaceae bacterium]
MKGLSIRLRLTLTGLLLLVLFFTLARLVFLAWFGPAGVIHEALTWKALWLGLRMDARLAALCLFPALVLLREGGDAEPRWKALAAPFVLTLNLVLCGTLLVIANIDDQRAKPWAIAFLLTAVADWSLFRGQGLGLPQVRRVWRWFLLAMMAAVALCYAVDAGSYAYIHTRLNGSLLQFMENPLLSGRMMWETYPVLRVMLAAIVGILFGSFVLEDIWKRLGSAPSPAKPRRILQGTLLTLGMLFLIWGRLNGYPLRWGDAYSLGQSFQAHLALNPVLFLLETAEDPSEGYDLAEVKATGPVLANYLGCDYREVDGEPRLWRVQQPRPLVPPGTTPNVVFLHLESFAASKTGTFGNPLDPTPRFDALAREGLLFDHFYAPAENTSRAMFAVLFGTADMSPGGRNSATRNPLLVDQRTILNDLGDYSKHYYLGGTGDWAQIRASLKNNLRSLDVQEEAAFKSPKVDVWGVADADFL